MISVEDFAGYVASMFIGAAIAFVIVLFSVTSPAVIVKQGWVSHDGKVYRVVPAEVKANVQ